MDCKGDGKGKAKAKIKTVNGQCVVYILLNKDSGLWGQ